MDENINIDEADAQMEKGLLTIKIPKTDGNNKGKIGVTVS